MTTYLPIILGFFLNILSSFIFLYLVLYLLRPKIAICEHIVIEPFGTFGATKQTYVFKIYNKSMFDAFDLQLQLSKLTQMKVSQSGINERLSPLELKLKEIKHLMPYMRTSICKKRSYAKHCILFRTDEPIEEILKDNMQTLQLQITLRHGLTGLSRVYKSEYINVNHIIEGEFEFGNSMNVIKK